MMRHSRTTCILVPALVCLEFVLATIALRGQTSSNWPAERAPKPLEAREVQFPPFETRTLSNGLQVVAVAHHEQPVVTIRLLVKAGAAQDPDTKPGVANLVSALLDQGTTTRTAEQIADQIDFVGGVLNSGSGADLTFVNTIVMKDSFDAGLDLVNDLARNPSFAPEEIDRQKQQLLSALQVNSRDPDYIADQVFGRLVFGFHAYGAPAAGTPESLAAITRDDLQQFHRQYFVPNNAILAIVGDTSADEAFAAAERVFGRWLRAEVPAPKSVEPPLPARRVVIIDKPDAVQTEIRVGQLAIPRKHDDYLAWDLAVRILGGEGANRLFQVLRSQRGLTYGASAETEARKQAGAFVAQTNTRTDTTAEALRLLVDEFSRLQRDKVRQIELAGAQDYVTGSFPLTIETPNEIAAQILSVLFYDLPVSEIGTLRERVTAITPEDIQRVARAYIKPDRLSIVLVGNARQFVQQLSQQGFSNIEVLALDQLDVTSPTLKRDARRTAAAPSSAPASAAFGMPEFARSRAAAFQAAPAAPGGGTAAPPRPRAAAPQAPAPPPDPASALIARIVRTKGGLMSLKNIRTVVADATTTLRVPQGPLPSTTRTYVVYPDKFRVDATVSGAQVVQAYNGGAAWVRDPTGVHDAPAAQRDDFAASVQRDIIPLLIAAAEGRVMVSLRDDEETAAGTVKVLELSGNGLSSPVRLSVNDQLFIVKETYTTPGPDGRPVRQDEEFSEYRNVEGIRIPFRAIVRRDGQQILDRTLTRVVLNSTIDTALFERGR